LGEFLKKNGILTVYIAGLALDYCVKYTALDAISLGFETFLLVDATRAVNLNSTDGAEAIQELRLAGANIIQSTDLI
jgi:nicotinamidase/pyrazinamidase